MVFMLGIIRVSMVFDYQSDIYTLFCIFFGKKSTLTFEKMAKKFFLLGALINLEVKFLFNRRFRKNFYHFFLFNYSKI